MFICEVTGNISQPGAKCHKIIVETRPKTYTKRVKNEDTMRWENVEVSKGMEIVKEISATEYGVELWNKLSSEDKVKLLKMPARSRRSFHI